MNFDEWSDTLLVRVLESEEATGNPEVDLKSLCLKFELSADDKWFTRFLKEQATFGQGATSGGYSFALDLNGRYLANNIRATFASKTFVGRLKSVSRRDWIALGAFIISLVALFK